MSVVRFFCVSGALAGLIFSAEAKVEVAPVFSDNMVLQREKKVPVWGKGDPGEPVSVSFAGQELKTKVGADGKWRVDFAPMSASAENRTLKVAGKTNSVEVKNVLVGEVWLCSGQSNMEMPLWTDRPRWRAADGDKAAAASKNPLIRIVSMKPYGWSMTPQSDFKMSWQELGPGNASAFSATAFFFGNELQKELKIPIGLIASHWGGTRIEPWTPPAGFDSVPELREIARAVRAKIPGSPEYKEFQGKVKKMYADYLIAVDEAAKTGKLLPPPPPFPAELVVKSNDQRPHQQPTVLYNRMIYPFVPFAFRGAIWYQGCSNRGEGMLYRHKMQALWNGWKQVFENPAMRFYFVQLAPFRYGGSVTALPEIWEAQEKFAQANAPAVGMAVINDVGNLGDIHPRDKTTVGKRLANLALRRDYGKTEISADAPVLESYKIEDGKFILEFRNVKTFQVKNGDPAQWFQIASASGVFQPAKVEINGKQLIVSAGNVARPRMVRYMWNQNADGRLFNEAGLPLGAFRVEPEITADDLLKEVAGGGSLLYSYDLMTRRYTADHRAARKTPFSRIYHMVEAESRDGVKSWSLIGCDAFTKEAMKLGIPVAGSGIHFQTKVANLSVLSNVPGVKTGNFAEGNIEMWPNNYASANSANIPGASSSLYDFGDQPTGEPAGYGSMQIHNFMEKQTVFAYNRFGGGVKADFGFGNSEGRTRDWTFSEALKNYRKAEIRVYVVD